MEVGAEAVDLCSFVIISSMDVQYGDEDDVEVASSVGGAVLTLNLRFSLCLQNEFLILII
jgi:hypothetical protein